MIDQLLEDLSSKFNAVSAEIFAKSQLCTPQRKSSGGLIHLSGRYVAPTG